jgi:hypothetical protein
MGIRILPNGQWIDDTTGKPVPPGSRLDPNTGAIIPPGGTASTGSTAPAGAAGQAGPAVQGTAPAQAAAAAAAAPAPAQAAAGGDTTTPVLSGKLKEWSDAHGGIASGPSPVKIKIDAKGNYIDNHEKDHPWQQYMFSDGSRLVVNDLQETEPTWTVDTGPRNTALGKFQTQFGNQVGQAAIDTKLSPDGSADPNPYYVYTFVDQNGKVTTVSMNASGQIGDAPKTTSGGPASQPVANTQVSPDGTKTTTWWERDAQGNWHEAKGLPPEVIKGDKAWNNTSWIETKDGKVLMGFDPADNVFKAVPGAPTVPSQPSQVIYQTTYDAQGHEVKSPMQYDPAAGQFVPAKGLAPATSPVGPPSAATTWVPVYRVPNDPTSGVIALQDPSSKETHPVAEKQPITWDDAHGQRWAWDGNLSHQPQPLGQPSKTITPYTGAGADQLNLTYVDEKGQIQTQPNTNFIPKTQADIAARAQQIHQAQVAMGQQVQAKVGQVVNGKVYTADDALRDFNQWYDRTITPQNQALQGAMNQVAYDRGKEMMTSRTSAQNAATSYGTGLANAFGEMVKAKPVTNPAAYAAASAELAKGKIPSDISGLLWEGPDPVDLYKQGAMNALKYIDPAAAAANGLPAPNYQNMDVSGLTRNMYTAPGVGGTPFAQTAPSPAAPNGVTPMGAGGTPVAAQARTGGQDQSGYPTQGAAATGNVMSQTDYDALRARQQADVALQQRQAQAMPAQNVTADWRYDREGIPPTMDQVQQQWIGAEQNPQPASMVPMGQPYQAPGVPPTDPAMPQWLLNGTAPDVPPQPPASGFFDPYWAQYAYGG